MKMRCVVALCLALMLLCAGMAVAEGDISTNVVMRVSRMTQNAVVDMGEDLTIDISVEGIDPSSYQWYFNDIIVYGATQKVYNIVDASEDDAGVYRLDAFDDAGNLILSVEVSVRVLSKDVPTAGDSSVSLSTLIAIIGVATLALVLKIRRQAAMN